MIRHIHAVPFVPAVFAIATTASAQSAPLAKTSGIELGVRAGYALPMGKVGSVSGTGLTGNSQDLADTFSGMLPLWVDLGYRVNPNLYVGGFFQYAIAFINTSKSVGCTQSGVSCSGSNLRFGANVHYHLLPAASFDPWAGLGAGYEIASESVSGGGNDFSVTVKGFELLNVQVGGDYRVSSDFALGPFVGLSVGQYGTYSFGGSQAPEFAALIGVPTSGDLTSKDIHEWLMFGIRGQFNP